MNWDGGWGRSTEWHRGGKMIPAAVRWAGMEKQARQRFAQHESTQRTHRHVHERKEAAAAAALSTSAMNVDNSGAIPGAMAPPQYKFHHLRWKAQHPNTRTKPLPTFLRPKVGTCILDRGTRAEQRQIDNHQIPTEKKKSCQHHRTRSGKQANKAGVMGLQVSWAGT